MTVELEPITRLARDIKEAAFVLSDQEARYLVDSYYQIQEYRKAFDNQVRALNESEEPNRVLGWFSEQTTTLEKQVQRALDAYSGAHPHGRWVRSVCGIGPVIAAGLLAHIDITKAPTVGHIWRFAGLDPTVRWEKGGKRPWNADLKTLCWKIGESFVKVKGREADVYGKIYEQRKADETKRNLEGGLRDQAAENADRMRKLKKTSSQAFKFYSGQFDSLDAHVIFEESNAARREGFIRKLAKGEGHGIPMLPPGHIHARAKRYAVKLFLAHFHEDLYERHYGRPAPLPYPIAHLEHAHKIEKSA